MSKFVNSALRMCYNLKKLTTNQMFQLYNIYRLVVCYIQKKKKKKKDQSCASHWPRTLVTLLLCHLTVFAGS